MDANQRMQKGSAERHYQLPITNWQLLGIFLLSHFTAFALAPLPPTTNYQLPTAFTNHAGHAVVGRLTAVSNNVAVIGGRVYPLAIFPDSEQARMRDLLQVPRDLSPALTKRRCALRERYLRNEALLKAGAKTSESAAAQRAKLEAAWRHALDSAALDPVTRSHWFAHLMD